MKLCLKILAIAATAATTYSLVGCAAPASFSYQNVSISFTAQCTDCPAGITFNPAYPMPAVTLNGSGSNGGGGGTSGVIPTGALMTMPATSEGGDVELLATVTNAPASNITWQIYPQPNLTGIKTLPNGTTTPVGENGSGVGTFATPGGSSTTATGPNVYYAQGGTPVYSGEALAQAQQMGICQGCVEIVATVVSNPDTGATVSQGLMVAIYGGSTAQGPPGVYLTPQTATTPAGLVNPVVSVAHNGGTYQFYGGVVGAAPCLPAAGCSITPPGSTTPVLLPQYYTDNTAVWEVGPSPFSLTTAFQCTTPASVNPLTCPYGTITEPVVSSTGQILSPGGLYTAPATIPTTGLSPSGEIVVVLISQLVGTVNAYAYVALY